MLGSMNYMPRTMQLVGAQGVNFDNFVTCTSVCCPSRVSMYTSLYTHNHNITGNIL